MLDEYINMTDGVKMTKKSVKHMGVVAMQSGNLHGCNSEKNREDAYYHWYRLKNVPTNRMIEAIHRINEICDKHGVDRIVFDVDNKRHTDRKFLGAKICKKYNELIDRGIPFAKEDTIKCGDCLYFRRAVGRSGFCRHMHAQAKDFYGCANAVKKA